jgi:hypothetical protein
MSDENVAIERALLPMGEPLLFKHLREPQNVELHRL